ncbi:MAG: ABC transporter ATP-binding protein [Saprospiraceae bacterium]|nr:ABC transporter ATP-binding protein [Saprospiraceae bacterium]
MHTQSINIDHVSKRFGNIQALNDVHAQLYGDQCIALIGPNGCGKSTLIKSVLGLAIPDRGHISVNGINISTNSNYREDIGYMPQIGRYPDHMKVHQVFDLIGKIRKTNKQQDFELYESYGISAIANQYMYTLSGGTRQKISAVLAFMYSPIILILDEPTSGLDPLSAETLKAKIKKVNNEGKLVIITSHILSDLDELCSHVIYMQDGQVLINKPYHKLQSETNEIKLTKMVTQLIKNNPSKTLITS